MELTSKEALNMLEQFRNSDKDTHWIDHSICVGDSAAKIAEALNLDPEKARTLGYIHDIGKGVGDFSDHIMNGYKYIKELGYDDEYANVCLTHSYLNNDVTCTAGVPRDIPFRTEFVKNHECSIYENIVKLCDLMCKENNMTLEKRLIDLIERYGVHYNTVYHVQEAEKLKKEFDSMLGYNVYKLFPNVLDN